MKKKIISIFMFLSSVLFSSTTTDVNSAISQFANFAKKKHSLRLITTGGSWPDKKINNVCLGFISENKMSIDQARETTIECVDEMLKIFNNHKKMIKYLKYDHLNLKKIEFSIIFSDKNYIPYSKPYINSVNVVEEKISYYYKPEKNNEREIIRETYKEAKKILENKILNRKVESV